MNTADAEPTPSQRSLLLTLTLVGASFLLTLALLGQLLMVVPTYERNFEDFRMRLPVVTEMTIAATRFAVKFWFLLIPCMFVAFGLAGLVSYLIRHRFNQQWLSAIWFLLLLGLPVLANATLWAALWLPYKRLEEGLRK